MSEVKVKKKMGRPKKNLETARISFRWDVDDITKLDYWVDKLEHDSRAELLLASFEHYIAFINADYPLPTAEMARVNQQTEILEAICTNIANLESSVISMTDSVLGLARGDNYLTKKVDGELI